MIRLTLSEQVDVKRLVSSALAGDPGAALALAAPLAIPSQFTELFIANGDTPEARLGGVQVIATFSRMQGDVRLAAEIALELIKTFQSLGWLDENTPPSQQLAVANVMDLCASCMIEAGLICELLDCGEAWSAWLLSRTLIDQWCNVQRSRVEACFHSGAYETASTLLSLVAHRSPSSTDHPVQRRLADKLDDLLRAADQPDTPSASFAWIVERSRAVLSKAGIKESLYEPILTNDAADGDRLRAALGLGPAPRGDDELSQHIAMLPEAANPLHEVSAAFKRLSDLLQNRILHPDRVAALAVQASEVATGYGFWEEAMTLRWLASIAERRAGRFTDAAVTLAKLRDELVQRQQRIRNPMLRAALSMILPHLYGVSAKVVFDLGSSRTQELFEIIEEAKSRILTALTLTRPDALIDRVSEVRKLLQRSPHRACYITLLADDDYTYAAGVLPDGNLTAVRLAMSRGHLAAAATELGYINDGEPRSIVREAGIDPDDPFASDYSKALSVLDPLAQWLCDLLESSALRSGDVICVSPDGPLYNLPLSALTIGRKPLIEYFAVSIAPCTEILIQAAANRSSNPLKGGFAVSVPRSTEFESGRYDRVLYDQDATALRKCWNGVESVEAQSATIEFLLSKDLSHKVVHIGAHGYFNAADPLGLSGVVLAFAGRLPPGRGYDGHSGLLTPKLAATLRAQGAHITLRACVSGRTTEVTSREALGMIWALFRAGSSSVVAGSWNVDVVSAQQLLTRFYESFVREQSVALALRKAMLGVRATRQAWSHPFHFAAFNTFGYWE